MLIIVAVICIVIGVVLTLVGIYNLRKPGRERICQEKKEWYGNDPWATIMFPGMWFAAPFGIIMSLAGFFMLIHYLFAK